MSAGDYLRLRKQLDMLEERVKVLEQRQSYPPARVPDIPKLSDGDDVVDMTRIDKRTKAWRERQGA